MIHIICNNVNSQHDGIGDYAYGLYLAFRFKSDEEVHFHSACSGLGGILDKLLSMKMSRAFDQVCKEIGQKDIVIIEYPFKECNIAIIRHLKKLRDTITQRQGLLFLSLHEYERVSSFRKYIIRHFIAAADAVLVTDNHTKGIVSNLSDKPVYLRSIPSNIYEIPIFDIDKDRRIYVYFGLITKAKAIDNMLQAWTRFNADNQYTLYFLTSSPFSNKYERYGVRYLDNLDKQGVAYYFSKAAFCILPIIPCVSAINATYKTALFYDCVPIGHFDEEISERQFFIDIDGNSVDQFYSGFCRSRDLSESEYKSKVASIEGMPHPTFENTMKEYLEAIHQYMSK